ncbi:MAG: leucine-rich repeat domain-containing protein [Oscillospiraceae bacterium]|nr:leucine-rich repeat domain-containing protein [Oscillospiraceae bacterium]
MSIRKRRQLFVALGAVLLALLAAIVLLTVLRGRAPAEDSGSYDRHFNAAEAAFNRRDYDQALDELDQALALEETEEVYLLMARVYAARGDLDHARRVLLTGYSNLGADSLTAMLDELNSGSSAAVPLSGQGSAVTVGGRTFPSDTSSVVLSNRGLENSDLAALCTLTNLENLSVSDNAITDLSPLSSLEKLTSLQLSNNNITDISPLSNLESLKTLYLDGNPVEDLSPLYRLHNLRTLSMKSVSVTASELSALEQALPDCYVFSDTREEEPVEELTLGSARFTTDVTELDLSGQGLQDISVLAKCGHLVKLDLRDNEISDLSPLAELHELEKLNLWNNRVWDLSPLMGLTRLSSLDLDGNRLSEIAPLQALSQLEELWLNNNALDGIEALRSLGSLRRLGLKGTGLTDQALDELKDLRNLSELALDDNPELSAEALEALEQALPDCSISYSEPLRTIELGGKQYRSDATEILASNQGITSLAGLEYFTSLETLDLDHNAIADFTPLYELTKLKKLSVRDNPRLTVEALDELRKRLPDCEIVADEIEETPEPSAVPEDVEAYDKGLHAALEAAGTGSGYALLSWDNLSAADAAREGFLNMSVELGLNLVYEERCGQDVEDFMEQIEAIRTAGADTVFLVMDDYTAGLFQVEAAAMDYKPRIVIIW